MPRNLSILLVFALLPLTAAADPPSRRVAVTIDDLPIANGASYRNHAEREAVVEGICRALTERDIPAVGFFNLSQVPDAPGLVERWIACGVAVGNHTWSHPRLRDVGLEAYLDDLQRGHDAVRELVGDGVTIPFRYPYLNQGFEPETRDAIRQRLAELASPYAPVTIDTWDWLYARGYTRALHAGAEQTAARYRQSWLWNLEESTERAEVLARELFGREPPQILLLHGNQINAEHIGEYFDWLSARGYTFVTLDEALSDPAYSEPDPSLSPTGDSFWLRLRRSRTLTAQ